MFCQPQLQEIIHRQRPDVIIEDNVNCFPALVTAGVPFVRSVSCQPLEMKGADIPPLFSGYSSDDHSQWAEFRAEYDRTHREMWGSYNDWVQSCGAPPLAELEFIHEGQANLYLYPEVADYTIVAPGRNWHRRFLGSCNRCGVGVPDQLRHHRLAADPKADSSIIARFRLADVDLMRRLVSVLGRTRHRFVVSKGPLADEHELPDNMWGAMQVPQTNVLPHVDLVITHGGNNTTTEAFHFGKPMIVLPLFWDQYDNAQRVHETGFGVRLPTYSFEDAQLIDAVERMLADVSLHARLDAIAGETRSRSGVTRAADLLERLI